MNGNPYTAPKAKLGEPEPRLNWFYGQGRFGSVLIAAHPVVRVCEHCGEERTFRLFVQTFPHLRRMRARLQAEHARNPGHRSDLSPAGAEHSP